MESASEKDELLIIGEHLRRLGEPFADIETLKSCLAHILAALNLDAAGATAPIDYRTLHRFLPRLQEKILSAIVPVWQPYMCEDGFRSLVDASLGLHGSASLANDMVAIYAIPSILGTQLTDHSLDALFKLTSLNKIDTVYRTLFHSLNGPSEMSRIVLWETHVKLLMSLPTRVANYKAGKVALRTDEYFKDFCLAVGRLFSGSEDLSNSADDALGYLLQKMVVHGLFSLSKPLGVTYFDTLMHRGFETRNNWAWRRVLDGLTLHSRQAILHSLLTSLPLPPDHYAYDAETHRTIWRASELLTSYFGSASPESVGMMSNALQRLQWPVALCRIVILWYRDFNDTSPRQTGETSAAGAAKWGDPAVRKILLDHCLENWTTQAHIRHSTLAFHQALTACLLLVLTYGYQNNSPALTRDAGFISAMQTYLSHLDPAVRRCGLLVAELAAGLEGRTLHFKDWDGEGQGREWARRTRALLEERSDFGAHSPAPRSGSPEPPNELPSRAVPESGDSDDSLSGYDSDEPSGENREERFSREELDEIERDLTVRSGNTKKIAIPVYLGQLLELLQTGSNTNDERAAEKLEMALRHGEDLVRRKAKYGTELDENAAELTRAFLRLQDEFELELFEDRRERALTALVACCPQISPIAIMDEFFLPVYSLGQRFCMLNALAFGAKELSGSTRSEDGTPANRVSFPSRTLDKRRHNKYLAAADISQGGLSENLLTEGPHTGDTRNDRALGPPRIKQLRLGATRWVSAALEKTSGVKTEESTFHLLAAEYFICPLIERYWNYLQNEHASEARSAYSDTPYRGAGTAMLLHPTILTHVLEALTVFLHCAHNSPAYLSILAPRSLEMAIVIGTRPMSRANSSEDKEADILIASLDLADVVISCCNELDRGQSLCLEHTRMVLTLQEWCTQIFENVEDGRRSLDEGGNTERLAKSAASVVLKLEKILSHWRSSIVQLGFS